MEFLIPKKAVGTNGRKPQNCELAIICKISTLYYERRNSVMKKVSSSKRVFLGLFVSLWLLAGFSVACWAQNPGVLVIAHGSPSEAWNQPVRDTVAQVSLAYPVELAFLEFVPDEGVQDAVDRLEAQGVDEIIVAVVCFISSHSSHIEEIKYILGLPYDEDVVDEEALAEEGLFPIESDAEFILTSALDDHPIIAHVLCDKARELSTNPSEEIVVITGHGAAGENLAKWSENMESLAARMKWELGVKDVRHSYVFPSREPYLRDVVEEAASEAEVIVIPLMISEGFFTDMYIPMQLAGLSYMYNGEALAPHPGFARWIELSALKALVELPPILIDSEEITLAEVREPEPLCCCRVAAFRVCQEAFNLLWEAEIPQSDDTYVISSHPSNGHREAFDYITKAVTRGDYELDIPEGTSIAKLTMENYTYGFIRKPTGDATTLHMKRDVFPERFLEFRNWIRPMKKAGTATPAQIKAFMSAKQHFIDRIITAEDPFYEIEVDVDIKPGSFPNSINLKSKGNVPVAVLSDASFDATAIDPGTVVFANISPLPIGESLEDVNGDGLLDAVFHFETQDVNLKLDDTEGCLSGKTLSGEKFWGCDSVRIIK